MGKLKTDSICIERGFLQNGKEMYEGRLFCMSVKFGLSLQEKNIGSGCLRTGC
jgi:hypothetical protein